LPDARIPPDQVMFGIRIMFGRRATAFFRL
jgi:hypothetical protein